MCAMCSFPKHAMVARHGSLIPHDMGSQLTVNQNQLNAAAHRALSHVNLTFADERGVEWREEAVFPAPSDKILGSTEYFQTIIVRAIGSNFG